MVIYMQRNFPGKSTGGGIYFYKIDGFQPPSWGGVVMSRRVSLLYFSDALALSLLDHPASARTDVTQLYIATSSSYGNILYIDIYPVCMFVHAYTHLDLYEIYSTILDMK